MTTHKQPKMRNEVKDDLERARTDLDDAQGDLDDARSRIADAEDRIADLTDELSEFSDDDDTPEERIVTKNDLIAWEMSVKGWTTR